MFSLSVEVIIFPQAMWGAPAPPPREATPPPPVERLPGYLEVPLDKVVHQVSMDVFRSQSSWFRWISLCMAPAQPEMQGLFQSHHQLSS